MDGLRYTPDDPYYTLGPVRTCLYVRVCETGEKDNFLKKFPIWQQPRFNPHSRRPVAAAACMSD